MIVCINDIYCLHVIVYIWVQYANSIQTINNRLASDEWCTSTILIFFVLFVWFLIHFITVLIENSEQQIDESIRSWLCLLRFCVVR